MKSLFLSVCLFIISVEASSQAVPFDSIPDNLKKRADAVIRSEQCLYTINKPGNATMKVKRIITLLNEDSFRYRLLSVFYDKFSRVRYLKGTIYDEKGEIIKILGFNDVSDMSAISGGSFYSDDRMKLMYFPLYKYPYTIEYEYEMEYTSILSYPSWDFHDDPDVSVEKSGIQFVVPKNMKLRYLEKNLKNRVDSVITSDYKSYTWQEENLPVIVKNDYSLKADYKTPVLYAAPLDFEYSGFKGSMSSWKTFGDWIFNLNTGQDILPSSEKDTISSILSRTKDAREIVKSVYKYVQSRTRYLSIQIGIGGFKPAEAASVSKNGFGDCKALVNYTMALLNAAGIKSYYTLVRAGDDDQIIKTFVDNQFNHAILCVPLQNDTVWLDCTSQTLPFNYLGDFTDDRYALLITAQGGVLVRTPVYTKNENVSRRTGLMFMNTLGASSGRMSNTYSGYNYGIASSLFGLQSEDELRQYLFSALRFSDINIASVVFAEDKSDKPSARLAYDVSVNDFAVFEGSKAYFSPSIVRAGSLPDSPSPLSIPESEIITDSISYYFPNGYRIEFLPSDVSIENEFGRFKYRLQVSGDRLNYLRHFEINKGDIPVEKYTLFREFINTVAKADRNRIILIKTGT